MDNLTHTLTGLAMSRAGLARLHPLAPALLMVSANAPDIDMVSLAAGPLTSLEYHRGFTHSLLLLPVMALISLVLVCAVARSWTQWSRALLLCMAGVGSHLLLDWTNTYGVRLLLPFSGQWFHLDLNSLFDVWIWAVLILAAVGPFIGKLVSSEIGARPGSGRGLACFALTFFILWDCGRASLHQRALATLDTRVYDGAVPLRTAAFPGAVNPLVWDAWINLPALSEHFVLNLSREFDATAGLRIYTPPQTGAIAAAKQTKPFQVFGAFDQYPLWFTTPTDKPEGGTKVELRDERFSFAAVAIVDAANQVQESRFHY